MNAHAQLTFGGNIPELEEEEEEEEDNWKDETWEPVPLKQGKGGCWRASVNFINKLRGRDTPGWEYNIWN
jgi:hypothetical protein